MFVFEDGYSQRVVEVVLTDFEDSFEHFYLLRLTYTEARLKGKRLDKVSTPENIL